MAHYAGFLKNLTLKKGTCTLRIDQLLYESVENCLIFIVLEIPNDAVVKMCRFEFRFQNLPFSKSAVKIRAVFV